MLIIIYMATPYEDSFDEVDNSPKDTKSEEAKENQDYSEDFEQLEDLQNSSLNKEETRNEKPKISKPQDSKPETEDPDEEESESNNPLVDKFSVFFNKYYKSKIEKLIEDFPKHRSLNVDFGLIEQFDPDLADELVENSEFCFEAMQQVVMNFQSSLIGDAKEKEFDPFVRVTNIPKDKRILIKNISSRHLGKFISIEGIVKQFTTVLPKLKIAHWICKKCGTELDLHQDGFEIIKPKACPECKHRDFFLDEKHSEFLDYQKLEMQELLEELKGGEQTSTINVFVFGDLVNTFTAGSRLMVSGVLKLRNPENVKHSVYGNYILCSSIEHSKQDYETVEISREDEEQIKEFANNPDIYNMLIDSVAPHIHGHEDIKEAIILQLFGGVRKVLEQKSKIRGNIHILLMGDPGLGKTQVLLYATQIAPKSIYVAGKTTTGSGLTATAVKDEFGEGGWTLKAGALVLASGGFAMIDEFDKIDDEDRSAMHECMEQESLSIAKAGIVTSFKTETSVLAAANPKYGRFDNYKTIPEQIEVPPTLLSRFDLFFVMKDTLDEKRDADTVASILRTHKSGELLQREGIANLSAKDQSTLDKIKDRPKITPEFIKKYISYARLKVFPVLADSASKDLQKFFINLRQKSQAGRVTVTYRQLEGLIRLSEASARIRLAETITDADVERAINIYKKSMEQVGLDPESGAFDIDIITTGQSHSTTSKMMRIADIIGNIVKDQKGAPAKLEKIVEESEKEGIDKTKVKELIDKLQKTGDIYEPKSYHYIPTKKEQ